MTTLADLIESISDTVQDGSMSDKIITKWINRGLKYISGKVLLSALESEGVVNSEIGVNAVDIPTAWNMQRNLYDCQVEDQGSIEVLTSLEQLTRVYPNYKSEVKNGPIEYVLKQGSTILYYPIPDAIVELKCGFYELPTPLVKGTDIPSCIPDEFQEELLENYACMKIFNLIEDAMDGKKANTATYMSLFRLSMEDLEDIPSTGQSRPLPRRSNNWV